jgi:hypothetical protein
MLILNNFVFIFLKQVLAPLRSLITPEFFYLLIFFGYYLFSGLFGLRFVKISYISLWEMLVWKISFPPEA